MELSKLTCEDPRCTCHRAAQRGHGLFHCPNHDDLHPSLSVTQRAGRWLVHCFGGCGQAELIAALRAHSLWPEQKREWVSKPHYESERRRLQLRRAAQLWQQGMILRLEAARREAWRRFLEAEAVGDDAGQRRAATDVVLLAAQQRQVARWCGAELIGVYCEARRRWPRLTADLVNDPRDDEENARQVAAACVAVLAAAQEIGPGGTFHDTA